MERINGRSLDYAYCRCGKEKERKREEGREEKKDEKSSDVHRFLRGVEKRPDITRSMRRRSEPRRFLPTYPFHGGREIRPPSSSLPPIRPDSIAIVRPCIVCHTVNRITVFTVRWYM